MYAEARRVRHIQDIDAASQKVRDDLLPLVRTVPGFVAYYLVDAVHSTYSVTVCEDKAGVDEVHARTSEWAQRNLEGLMETPAEIIAGEVVVSDHT